MNKPCLTGCKVSCFMSVSESTGLWICRRGYGLWVNLPLEVYPQIHTRLGNTACCPHITQPLLLQIIFLLKISKIRVSTSRI